MDKKQLLETLETNTLKTQFNVLRDPQDQDDLMREKLAELAERDAAIRASVTSILEVTGSTDEVGTRHSPSIQVGQIEHPVLGAGMLTASVRQGINHNSVDTYFWLARPNRKDETFAGEHYSVYVSDDFVAYARAEARNSLAYGGPHDVLQEKMRRDLPKIEAAELTQSMLWDALQDSELNPLFAEKARALQEDYTV